MTYGEHIHELAEISGKGDSEAMHKILACAMTDEEAGFVLALPASDKDLAEKFRMTEKEVGEKMFNLAQRGIIIPAKEGYKYNPITAILHDHILSSAPEFIPEGMEKLWMELYTDEEWWKEIAEMYNFFTDPILRVVPAEQSVDGTELMANERLSKIIEANSDLISLRQCCCRTGADCCDHPRDTCIQFKQRAEFDLHRGSGRKISTDEAIGISRSAAKAGLVPIVTNLSSIDKIEFICFCCGCACLGLNPGIRGKTLDKLLNPSRFRANINHESCKSCKQCMKRCQFGAVEMKEFSGLEKPRAVLDPDKCLGCGVCQVKCKSGSITMEEVRSRDFIPDSIADEAVLNFFQ